jgi:uncharacterized membrane protein
MTSSDYRSLGRDTLAGRWGEAVLVAFVASIFGALLTQATSSLNINVENLDLPPVVLRILMIYASGVSMLSLVQFILGGTVRLGYATYLLKQYDRRENSGVGELFGQFGRFGDGFCLAFLTGLFIFLWSLLLVIPGIIAALKYSMAPFIMAENPNMTARQALNASTELMDGHKTELFFLELSFIGWMILNAFTLGIGSFWLNPYMNATLAAFYRSISRPMIVDAI